MIPGMGETTIWGRSVEFLHLYVAMMLGGGGQILLSKIHML